VTALLGIALDMNARAGWVTWYMARYTRGSRYSLEEGHWGEGQTDKSCTYVYIVALFER
jgi:hypothetical protein